MEHAWGETWPLIKCGHTHSKIITDDIYLWSAGNTFRGYPLIENVFENYHTRELKDSSLDCSLSYRVCCSQKDTLCFVHKYKKAFLTNLVFFIEDSVFLYGYIHVYIICFDIKYGSHETICRYISLCYCTLQTPSDNKAPYNSYAFGLADYTNQCLPM